MFELVPYILTLNSEAEIMLIEDLEPGPDGLPKMSKVFPTMMVNHQTGKKMLTLIKEDHLDEFKSKIQFISAQDNQPKIKSHEKSRRKCYDKIHTGSRCYYPYLSHDSSD